jgi:hypothetical protein
MATCSAGLGPENDGAGEAQKQSKHILSPERVPHSKKPAIVTQLKHISPLPPTQFLIQKVDYDMILSVQASVQTLL